MCFNQKNRLNKHENCLSSFSWAVETLTRSEIRSFLRVEWREADKPSPRERDDKNEKEGTLFWFLFYHLTFDSLDMATSPNEKVNKDIRSFKDQCRNIDRWFSSADLAHLLPKFVFVSRSYRYVEQTVFSERSTDSIWFQRWIWRRSNIRQRLSIWLKAKRCVWTKSITETMRWFVVPV